MYLCVCKAVPEQRARMAIDAGACRLRDLNRQLGIGGGCGRCIPDALKLLRETQPAAPESEATEVRAELAA